MKISINKQLFSLAVLLLTQFENVNAQQNSNANKPPFVKPKVDSIVIKDVRLMKNILNLSPEQETKMRETEKTYMEARTNIPATMSSADRRNRVKELQQKFESDLKNILTIQQYKQYLDEIEIRRKLFEQKWNQKKPAEQKGS